MRRLALLCRRRGQREVAVAVEVEPEGFPEFHTPAPKLAELLGLPAGATTRDEVLHALWRYIRTHQLQARARSCPASPWHASSQSCPPGESRAPGHALHA